MVVSRPEHNGTRRLPSPDPGHGEPVPGAAGLPPQIHPPSAAPAVADELETAAAPAAAPAGITASEAPEALAPATLDAVLEELRAVRRAIEAQIAGPAELLDSDGAAALLGLARSTFFRLVALGTLPRPLKLSGQLRRWRRSALLVALDELEGRSKRRRPGS